jgi:sugar phosphate isomerase/epimerase
LNGNLTPNRSSPKPARVSAPRDRALYGNPLDPPQTDFARATFRRAIEVAAHIGVKTVAGFAGAVIETELNERGGNLVYKPFENYLPPLLAFWEPLANFAADHGVRIAFEHCPQGAYHLPVMGYNMLGQPAMWERLFDATTCGNLASNGCQPFDLPVHRSVTNIINLDHGSFMCAKDAPSIGGCSKSGHLPSRVAEHRMVGLGQANWAEIAHSLLRAGYDSDLNIEGWHDPVYRDHDVEQPPDVRSHDADRLAGRKLEEAGLLIAKRTLDQYTPGMD